ncbi:MAG: hypothetical protein WCD81_11420 [Candidatus Bathyarchaeia archaeon]
MLLCEQERNLAAEKSLINDPTSYQTSSTSLVTIHDYGNITVPAGGSLVIFSADSLCSLTAGISGVIAIQVGSLMYAAGYCFDANSGPANTIGTKHLSSLIWLPAGTYDVSVVGLTAVALSVGNMKVGLVNFNDVQPSALAYYTSATNSIQLTVPNRTLPVGSLNQAVFAINICTSGTLGSTFNLTVDGVAHTDMDEISGVSGTEPINGYYIYKLYIPLSVGVQHTVAFTLSSGAVAYVSVVACPWILAAAGRGHQPFLLSFSQLSTFYINIGSLFADGTKNCYIGISKSISYGASDYYASGTVLGGVLSFSYTFTSLNVIIASLTMDSSILLGACVENIGVDIQ